MMILKPISILVLTLMVFGASLSTHASQNTNFGGTYVDGRGSNSHDKNGYNSTESNFNGNTSEASGDSSEKTSPSSYNYRLIQAVRQEARAYKASGKAGVVLKRAYADYVIATQTEERKDGQEEPTPLSLSQYADRVLE